MKRTCTAMLAGFLSMPLLGCGEDGITSLDLGPFRDDWQIIVDGAEFPYIVMDEVMIQSITIGGAASDGNFDNRGDIIVTFDGDPGTITVEMRRFAWSNGQDEADEAFDRLSLWAYNSSVDSPKPPGDMDEANNCAGKDPESGDPVPWMEGCGIRVYYEGQLEPKRFGADLRVTLPPEYRHTVNVVTSDNNFEEDYLNRGNVCLSGLNGTASVEMEQGVAYVILDEATTPGPRCPQEDIDACDTWEENGEPAAWSISCPCNMYGGVTVKSTGTAATDVTFDVPASLWASLSLNNLGEMQTESGDHCDSTVEWPEAVVTQDASWRVSGEANDPGPAAPAGGGFSIRGESGECTSVLFTEDPEDYVGAGKSDDQESEIRGDLEICNGCVRGDSCDKLLPGK